MTRHPGLGPEHSGSNAFFSDANLDARAVPAGYGDFAPLPGEVLGDAVRASGALQAHVAAGGSLHSLQLAEVEIDEGGRSADLADNYLSAPVPPVHHYAAPTPPVAPADTARLDRLEANIERLTNLLLGENK